MKMTFDEYIKNPMGKENAVFSQRNLFKELYTKKFDAVLAREAGRLKYVMFKDNDSRYLFLIRIPSEVIRDFYYDVVIEFTTKDNFALVKPTLDSYDVKFFSNDPAFVFTFAYSFNANKLFIQDLEPKMSKIALQKRAVERNPKNIVGYVKSIYFAYLYMQIHGLMNKATWFGAAKYNKQNLLSLVVQADIKIEERQRLGAEKLKDKNNKKENKPTANANTRNIVNPTSTVRVIKRVGAVSNIHRSHKLRGATRTKHTKYVKRK